MISPRPSHQRVYALPLIISVRSDQQPYHQPFTTTHPKSHTPIEMKHVTVYSSLFPVSLLPVCDMAPGGVPNDTDDDADMGKVVNGMDCDVIGSRHRKGRGM